MDTANEVLAQVKRRRQLEEAITRLRTRNWPSSLVSFGMALFLFWRGWESGITQIVNGKSVLLADGASSAVIALLLLIVGADRLWVRPNDRLLLLLADDALAKTGAPDRPSGPLSQASKAGGKT